MKDNKNCISVHALTSYGVLISYRITRSWKVCCMVIMMCKVEDNQGPGCVYGTDKKQSSVAQHLL